MIKKTAIYIVLLLFTLPLVAQETHVSAKEKIEGRWHEYKRIQGDSTTFIIENPDTYIFKENMVFHKGEATDGMILFNIAGKYKLEDGAIIIYYQDYLDKNVKKQSPKKLVFKLLSLSKDEMHVLVQDYNYEYEMMLKKALSH
ncbi:hypothetical protein [Dysgonomonas sp. 511]|uniref:hypothetical protein n=1 Tax=Dysgonomonas sp. 511 TaxID=2302930 RepID=UPI0013D7535B|nr:hypothetical protein [Dysgonomonas sp. 511]NDV78836.1 hypothetical protein [Dysgonomonas sp. 511]